MNLRSGQAFWPSKNGLLANYPAIESDLECDVLVIGAGITGAMLTYLLVKEGINVVTLEKRDVASGSTSASTALLQYEIDTHLIDLIKKIGPEAAAQAYLLCLSAIDKVGNLAHQLGDTCSYQRKPSLYYASRKRDASILKEEYLARKKIGIDLHFWNPETLKEHLGFSAPAALYSKAGAQLDPYRMTHQLLKAAQALGARIFDQTEVLKLDNHATAISVYTTEGYQVNAKKVVFATGYESQSYLKTRVVDLLSSYAIVSEPLNAQDLWYEQALIWESARPYLYIRTTEDQRILVGGEDLPFRNPRVRDALLARKTQRLEDRFKGLFPTISFKTAYAWTGTFGETRDGLAYIGETPEYPNAYFALGYGGNGITYSMIGAEIIRDLYLGKPNPDQHIFRFGR